MDDLINEYRVSKKDDLKLEVGYGEKKTKITGLKMSRKKIKATAEKRSGKWNVEIQSLHFIYFLFFLDILWQARKKKDG